jgi:hypothetical protein
MKQLRVYRAGRSGVIDSLPISSDNTLPNNQELPMPDENDIQDTHETSTPIAGEDVPKESKPRQARKPKVSAEATGSTDLAASEKPAKKTRVKRGSKAVAEKPSKSTARSAAGSTAVDTSTESVASEVEPSDDFADLIKLEEENKSLRKQLSEKLRAENAELRKRLGQN